MTQDNEVTRLLEEIRQGDQAAGERLLPLVYDELRKLARSRLSRERPGQTLQPTALVHEAYLRLVGDGAVQWDGRGHFFAAAAEAMRRILIEQARSKKCQKRGAGWHRTEMDVSEVGVNDPPDEILQVHEVLDQFAEVDKESAMLVKLRFFAGLTMKQCADILGISKRTADSRWAFARAWLFRAIQES